ncbi:Protein F31F7.1 a [Aphelenchoides avenae]|nr:Protein F31F7.1 a [Aphelenchus avenae]
MEHNFDFLVNPDNSYWDDIASEIALLEGWPLCPGDYATWLKAFGPENFQLIIAVDKGTKKAVASVDFAVYKSKNGSKPITAVGMVYVRPAYRSQGLSLELFKRIASDPAVASMNQVLVAVPRMSPKYAERFGFGIFGETVHVIQITAADIDLSKLDTGKNVGPVDEDDWPMVLEYDRKFTGGVDRESYLRALTEQDGAVAKVVYSCAQEIIAFGILRRPYHSRLFVGPVYARNEYMANTLLANLIKSVTDLPNYTTLDIQVPTRNKEKMLSIMNEYTGGKARVMGHMIIQFTREKLEASVKRTVEIYFVL